MKRAAVLVVAMCSTSAFAQKPAYDPMADLVSTAKKEIDTQKAIESGKEVVHGDPRYPKVKSGFWQFMQGIQNAKPGESCIAVFWKGDKMISITGPGGSYRGALLSFVAVSPPRGFPRPDNPKAIEKVKVSLKQGSDAPVTVTTFNRTIVDFADEIAFAVPTIEDLMGGMDDKLAFKIDYGGKEIFDLEWHSGHAARAMLQRCLKGEKVDGKEVP